MKNTFILPALLAAGVCVSAQAADVTAGVDFKSAYVASGATCNDKPVIQPCVEVSNLKIGDTVLPIGLGFWGNIDLDDKYDAAYNKGRFSEIDLNVDLILSDFLPTVENLSYSIGYLEYDYPAGGAADNLITATISYKGCYLNPKVGLKYRFAGDSKDKCEYYAQIGHSWDIAELTKSDAFEGFKFGLSADCYYTIQGEGSEKEDGFTCADFTATLSYKSAYISCTYVARLDDDVLPNGVFGYDAKVIGAVGVSYDF